MGTSPPPAKVLEMARQRLACPRHRRGRQAGIAGHLAADFVELRKDQSKFLEVEFFQVNSPGQFSHMIQIAMKLPIQTPAEQFHMHRPHVDLRVHRFRHKQPGRPVGPLFNLVDARRSICGAVIRSF